MSKNDIERGEPKIDRLRVAEGTNLTDHDLFFYQWYLKFSAEDYQGGKILDVGSGFDETFAREAKKKGVEVISLNPALASKTDKERRGRSVKKKDSAEVKSVAGLAQELPFKDNSFEAVTSLFSVPRFLEDKTSEYEAAFSEMIRVVKPGGKVYVYPIDREKVEGQSVPSLIKKIAGVEKIDSYLEENSRGHDKLGLTITKISS